MTQTAENPTCYYTLNQDRSSTFYGFAAGSGSFQVIAPSGCSWTATTSTSWITIIKGGTGKGTDYVTYSVPQNTNISKRSGTITVQDKTYTVWQFGTACAFDVPERQVFSASGGSGLINISGSS